MGARLSATTLGLLVAALAALSAAGPVDAADRDRGGPAAITPEQYEAQMRMFRAMRPKLIIEVTEANVNAYLRDHPDEFDMPEGLEAPRVSFGSGYVEVSARASLLFVPSRVSVRLAPSIRDGHLELRVTRVSAGWMPLPRSLHGGVAEMITDLINNALDLNGVKLSRVEIVRGLVRATATVHPREEAADGPREPQRRRLGGTAERLNRSLVGWDCG